TETKPDDVLIAAYPKSGSTWLQNLAVGMVYGADPSRLPDPLVNALSPIIEEVKWYRRFREPMLLTSHGRPQPQFQRVIYLVRDGRDAMVSFWHHLEAIGGHPID